MKDSAFLSADVSTSDKERMLLLIEHESTNFVKLVDALGLDRATQFRHVDLSFVNFDNCDLRGFDFTGSCLKGATGRNVNWDDSTIFEGAELDASIFDESPVFVLDHPLPESFLRQHWTDQIIWMDSLRTNSDDYREDARKLLFVFLRSSDPFVRRTAMNLLSKYVPNKTLIEIIDDTIFQQDEKDLVGAAFKLLARIYRESPLAVTKLALGQLAGRWATESAIFLGRILPRDRRLRHLVELISRHESQVVRRRFISALAERDGAATLFAIREPLTGDVFDFGSMIRLETLDIITRAVIRKRHEALDAFKRGEHQSTRDGPRNDAAILEGFSGRTHDKIRAEVIQKIEKFNDLGIKYKLPIFGTARLTPGPFSVATKVHESA